MIYTADARVIISRVLFGIDNYGLFGCFKYKRKENDTQNKDIFSGKIEKNKQASAIFLYLYIYQAEEKLDELGGTEGPDRPLPRRTYLQLTFTSWFYLLLQ